MVEIALKKDSLCHIYLYSNSLYMPHWNETNDLLYWNMYSATQKNQGQPRQRLEVMCWLALPYIEILEEVVHLLSPDLMAQKFLRFHLFWTLLILMQSKQTETDKKRLFSGKDNLKIQWNTITKTNLFPVFNTCGCVCGCVCLMVLTSF